MSSAQFTVDRLYTNDLYVNGAQISHPTLASLLTDDNTNNVGINNNNPKLKLDISGTDGLRIPVGITNERPAIDTNGVTDLSGVIRYNSQTNQYEAWALGEWQAFGGSKLELYTKEQGNNPTIKLTKIVNTYGGNDDGASIEFDLRNQSGSHTYQAKIYAIDSSNNSPGYGSLCFQTANGGNYQDRMTMYHDGNVGIGTKTPEYILDISSTGAIRIPAGTTTERNNISVSGKTGLLRYNTESNKFEGYGNNSWGSLGDEDAITEISGNVATNTTNITTNTTDIDDLSSNVATNTTNITINTTDIDDLSSNVATNTTNITINTTDIDDLSSNVATNTTNIDKNTSDINDLSNNGTSGSAIVENNYFTDFSRLFSCGNHCLCVLNTGKLLTCGDGSNSATFHGNTTSYNVLTEVSSFTVDTISYNGTNAIEVSQGMNTSYVLLSSGAILCSGKDDYSQLGDNNSSSPKNYSKVHYSAGYDGTNAVKLAQSSTANSMGAILDTGQLIVWGRNHQGQLGDGTQTNRDLPIQPTISAGYDGTNAVDIGFGNDSCIVLLNNGKVICAGYGIWGQMGNGGTGYYTTFIEMNTSSSDYDGTNAVAIACGEAYSWILLDTGALVSCGRNHAGQLGIGVLNGPNQTTLSNVNQAGGYDGTNAIAVQSGYNHVVVLLNNGKILTCGLNTDGQLGVNSITSISTLTEPTHTVGYNGTNVKSLLRMSKNNTAVMLNSGQIITCGGDIQALASNASSDKLVFHEVNHSGGYDGTNVFQNSLTFSIIEFNKIDPSSVALIGTINKKNLAMNGNFSDDPCADVYWEINQNQTINGTTVTGNYSPWHNFWALSYAYSNLRELSFKRNSDSGYTFAMIGFLKNGETMPTTTGYAGMTYGIYIQSSGSTIHFYSEALTTTSNGYDPEASVNTSMPTASQTVKLIINSQNKVEVYKESTLIYTFNRTIQNSDFPLRVVAVCRKGGFKDVNIKMDRYVDRDFFIANTNNTKFISQTYNFDIFPPIDTYNRNDGIEALHDLMVNNGSALYIDSNKNVGIGNTSPSYKLAVNGQIYASNGGLVGSDDRIKHNEQPIVNALSIISKLKPKHYIKTGTKLYDASHNFQLDASGNPLDALGNPLKHIDDYIIETGIIAQEIQKIPELKFVVFGEEYREKEIHTYKKDASGNNIQDASGNSIIENTITEIVPEDILSVDYNSIHCTHIAATQEIDKIQQEEKAKLAAAETKLTAAETEITTLKTQLAAVLTRLDALENP
jgi:alpha-tubulin suppressor-like RCC1 family protein